MHSLWNVAQLTGRIARNGLNPVKLLATSVAMLVAWQWVHGVALGLQAVVFEGAKVRASITERQLQQVLLFFGASVLLGIPAVVVVTSHFVRLLLGGRGEEASSVTRPWPCLPITSRQFAVGSALSALALTVFIWWSVGVVLGAPLVLGRLGGHTLRSLLHVTSLQIFRALAHAPYLAPLFVLGVLSTERGTSTVRFTMFGCALTICLVGIRLLLLRASLDNIYTAAIFGLGIAWLLADNFQAAITVTRQRLRGSVPSHEAR